MITNYISRIYGFARDTSIDFLALLGLLIGLAILLIYAFPILGYYIERIGVK